MKQTILVIDDEKDIRESVRDLLQDEGFTVVIAKNGKDGITKAKKHKPDLILLDILMPGLTTKEILPKLPKKTPIVLVTVVRFSELATKKDIKNMITDYVEKPFVSKNLVGKIKKIVGSK